MIKKAYLKGFKAGLEWAEKAINRGEFFSAKETYKQVVKRFKEKFK